MADDPTVRLTEDGPARYRTRGYVWERGDEHPVPADLADALVVNDYFERVDAADTCEAVKSDGEVCGRELPCQYHGGDD